MRLHKAHALLALCLVAAYLAEYLCFSHVPLVPSPAGGAPFGAMASFLSVPPVVGRGLVLAQPIVCFPLGTVVTRTFTDLSYSPGTLVGWPRAVLLVAAPLGVHSLHAIRFNLLWLSTLNLLVQVAFISLAFVSVRRIRRRGTAV